MASLIDLLKKLVDKGNSVDANEGFKTDDVTSSNFTNPKALPANNTSATAPASSKPASVTTPKIPAASAFKPAMQSDFYTPTEGSLAFRSYQRDLAAGNDYKSMTDWDKSYFSTYYKTVDAENHTKMYRDLEALSGGSTEKNGKDFKKQYADGLKALRTEMAEVKKQYGANSNEYRALAQFKDDYFNLGRQISANYVDKDRRAASRKLDDTIDTILSGVVQAPDYQEKVEAGRKAIESNPTIYHRYKLGLEGASDTQRDLMYYIYANEGDKGAREFFDRVMGDTINYQKAASDFVEDITTNDTKAARFWEANKANFAAAIDGQFGTGVRQLFTNTKTDPDNKTIIKGYEISDSVDDFLRQQIALDEEELAIYGDDAFARLSSEVSADWVKEAAKDASDYQKGVLGYLYLAYKNPEASKDLWEEIKGLSDEIWQMTNPGTISTAASSIEGQMYRDYLGLGGSKAPSWMGNPGEGEEKEDLTVAQALWDFALTTRAQYPQMAGNILGALAGGPLVGQVLGSAIMSTSVYGNSYKESIDQGYSPKQAAAYGVSQAMSEFGTDMLLSGIAPYAGALTGNVGRTIVRRISNPFLQAVANLGIRSLGEGLQEYVQDIIDVPIRNIIFQENNKINLADSGAVYSFFLGAMSAAAMSSPNIRSEININKLHVQFGRALTRLDSTQKLVDTIVNSKPAEDLTKGQRESYDKAVSIAKDLKAGRVNPNNRLVGEMFANAGEGKINLSWIENPATKDYNKDALTVEDMAAGARARLAELHGNVDLAEELARYAGGEQVTAEFMQTLKDDAVAAQVFSELMGELDMENDKNALTIAARSTTRDNTGNKVYDTLKAENTTQTVADPATTTLFKAGVDFEEAQQIGAVIEKVANGQTITEDEAELIPVGNSVMRQILSDTFGVTIAEDATIGAVMEALNTAATTMAETRSMQQAVADSAQQAAQASMPIPPNRQADTTGTVSMAGVEMTHDQFINEFMQKPGATLEQAEAAWANARTVSAALNGEENTNGRRSPIPSNPERRNESVAAGGTVQESTERGAQTGGAVDTGGGREGGAGPATGEATERELGYDPKNRVKRFNAEQRKFLLFCRELGFNSIVLVKGELNYEGTPVNARFDPETRQLTIRWDNPVKDIHSVAMHEAVHLWLTEAFGNSAARYEYVNAALKDIFGEDTAAYEEMVKKYSEAYKKAYSGLDAETFLNYVNEEILADMYGGMENYGAKAGQYQQQAEMYLTETNLREGDVERDYGGEERFSLNDPFRNDDVDSSVPLEVRPLPGEEDAHPDMSMLSITGMAEGGNFELQLNDDGLPYSLIDKNTGERVDHVTSEMMVNTPLGNIVNMAVEGGNITEAQAAQQFQMLADVMNLIIEYKDAAMVWEIAGAQLFSAMKWNADDQYTKTIDFSTICKKTMPIVAAMSEAMKQAGRGLTRREVEVIYEKVGKQGLTTPCPVCYVFSRWIGVGGLLDQIRVFQEQYANEDEATLAAFMNDMEQKAWELAREKDKADYFKKGKAHTRENMSIGKVLSYFKSGPNRRFSEATEVLSQHYQAVSMIEELKSRMPEADTKTAKNWNELIEKLQASVLNEDQIRAQQEKMKQAEIDIEPYERYQWLAKTVMMKDGTKIGKNGESIQIWKKNSNYNPVPKDVLFDLNAGAEFAKNYPLTWAFRTGKGCSAGKAMLPYTDARVGLTIQGAAVKNADGLKNLRKGGLEELQKILEDPSLTKRQKTNKKNRLNEFLIGDVKRMNKTLTAGRAWMKRQNLIGGMRYQSTSDFRYEFGSDYLMTFLEMQALGANVQLYTKVIEAVDFLASTGADCNLSVMPLGDGYVEVGKDAKGNPIYELRYSSVTGINADAAINKSKQYDNVQLILVGINDLNIKLALEGTDVTFVIPFHGSGQSVHQVQTLMDLIGENLDVYKAKDYSDLQNDHVSPTQTKEQKAMWDLRMAIIMGKCEKGLDAQQQALLAKNPHLQKLYDMFYMEPAAYKKKHGQSNELAYQNYLAKEQAQHIFPYEYWDKRLRYDQADQNGETFKAYCESMGIIPRFSGKDSDGVDRGYGNFAYGGENGKSVKGYWKLLIDRSMYENEYNEQGEWVGYGKYREQQKINMTNIDIGDLNPATGEAQFPNGEMSKPFDAENRLGDSALIYNAVGESMSEIEAMRANGDIHDKAMVSKEFRDTLLKAKSELRNQASLAGVDNNNERFDLSEATNIQSIDEVSAADISEEKDESGRSIPRYSIQETDPDTLAFLNDQLEKGEVVHAYKTFLEIKDENGDVQLYAPMATKRSGEKKGARRKMSHPLSLNTWEKSVGNPNSKNIFYDEEKKGWYYNLIKDNGDTVPAAYDPYQHASNVVLNDQFESAYKRPGLVTYEVLIPKSELTSGFHYRAERDDGRIVEAALPVGEHPWKKGPIANSLANTDRVVYMSRWLMPIRRIDDSTVAQMYKDILDKEENPVAVPFNVVPPGLQAELEKLGVPIDYNGSGSYISLGERYGKNKYPTGQRITEAGSQQRYSVMDQQHNDWAPAFYSKMANTINEWTNGKGQPLGAKMAANQVVGWLKGKGVKSEEIKWSGIVPFLEGKKSVTKEELQQVMAWNEIPIRTITLGGGGFSVTSYGSALVKNFKTYKGVQEHLKEIADREGISVDQLQINRIGNESSISSVSRTDTGEWVADIFEDYEEAPKWGNYTLPNGHGYREILFQNEYLSYTNNASSQHWGKNANGTIAHARVNDMVSQTGEAVLFVEEIQSDLHNMLAKHKGRLLEGEEAELRDIFQSKKDIGTFLDSKQSERYYELFNKFLQPYAEAREKARRTAQSLIPDDLSDTYRRVDVALNDAGFLDYDSDSWMDGIIKSPITWDPWDEDSYRPSEEEENIANEIAYEVLTDEEKKYLEANREYRAASDRFDQEAERLQYTPPDTPFAGSSDTYHEYVMKQLLRMAAEQDYDKIGWTTAQQQSDRWSDAFAEGYKIEYDQTLPKFMNKYVKQWGGKVGSTTLENGEEVWSVDITPEMQESVLKTGQPLFSIADDGSAYDGPYTSEAEWRKAVKDGSIEYTPEMEERWGLSDGDMVDCDAAITEMLDKIDEIEARIKKGGKWYANEIYGLSWYKEGFTDFIDLMRSPSGEKMLRFMIRNADAKSLKNLKLYPIMIYSGIKNRYRKEISKFNKIIDKQLEGRGYHNLKTSENKSYALSDIRKMFDKLNSNTEIAPLAKKVFDSAERLEAAGLPTSFRFTALQSNKGTIKGGDYTGGKIRYNTSYFNDNAYSDQDKAQTLLHELIHAYSASIINLVHQYNPYANYSPEIIKAYNALPQDVIDAVSTLDDIFNEIRYDPDFVDADGNQMYGAAHDSEEMIAELANPEFREKLRKKSLLQRIIDAVKRLFGIQPSNTFDAVSAGFDKLLSTYDDPAFQEADRNYLQSTGGFTRFSVAEEQDTDERFSVNEKNPFPEGSAEQQMLDVLNNANKAEDLQDYINKLIEKRNESIARSNYTPPALPQNTLFPVNEKQKQAGTNQLQNLINKFGALKKGEKAARDKSYPERTSKDHFVQRTARTAAEAASIPEYFADQIDQAVLSELLTYARITDQAAIKVGDGDFNRLGYKKAIKEWNENRASTEHQATKFDIAFGERLLVEAARNNDAATAMKVLADLATMGTQAGQVVQAIRMLKDMGPIGQLYYIQKSVDRINKDNAGRIAKGTFQPITIDQKKAEAVVLSNTKQEMEKNMEVLIQSIADQIPVTMKDKWDAWRYFAMLGNPRTHIRNIFGNAIFAPVRFAKDLLAAAGESVLIKDPNERTKNAAAAMKGQKYQDVREFALEDFENMQPYIVSGSKMNPLNEIMSARKIFKSPVIGENFEKLRRWNDERLNAEDIRFLRKAYVSAFTQFVAARGLTAEQLNGPKGGAVLNEAREYASLEAQKATYRDFSRLAAALNSLRRNSGMGLLLDGLLPFTKTPINILRRGVEYSPVGLMKGTYDALFKVKRGDITAAQAIDEMAAGLTGTGVAILGYILASMGLARGADDDDKKKSALEEAEGHQSYSLEIPGVGSYTIDWMAPVALPFFVGVETHKQLVGDGEGSFWDFCNALTLLCEPMMSLSMLDGINSTLAAVKSDQNSPVWAVLSNILASYVSQGAPTFAGQVARTFDPDRRSTYVDKNIEGPALIQRTIQGIQGKTPWANKKMAYVDVWGRKDTNASFILRALENFASPGYANRINETPVDTELLRLYDAVGDNAVLPATVAKYFQVEGETLNLSAKQYEQYKTVTGQTAFELLGELMDDPIYDAMEDAQKAAAVKDILSASTAIGKKAVAPAYKADTWVERAIAQDNLEIATVYHVLKNAGTGLSGYQLIEAMDWLTNEDRGKLIMSERSNTERNMTDYTKKKHKFVLTDEQIAREREIYNGLFWSAYNELIYSQKFMNADLAGRANLISKMQSSLGEAARRTLGDELRAAGYTSVLQDDSDVPDQVIGLYDLLNRG